MPACVRGTLLCLSPASSGLFLAGVYWHLWSPPRGPLLDACGSAPVIEAGWTSLKTINTEGPVEQMQRERSLARENRGILLLGLFALHDLARACSRIHEDYKDNAGKCKLDVYALRYGWKGNTTTETLEIETDSEDDDGTKLPCPEGSGIAHVPLLKHTLGRLLEEADSFKEAAVIIANICFLHFASNSEPFEEHTEGCEFLSHGLLWIRRRASFEMASIKAARESKGVPMDREEKEKLGALFDQLHVTSLSEQLLHQLERFHVTAGASLWPYKSKSYEHVQEKKTDSDDSEEEEKEPLLRSG
ncbi:hypothetical protein BJ878DRAFT_577723 [Calycina marina]|uniref:Uncharacterized protein n=1 Tax=Calycina marina TaxID=1763456 RepID=A0A9P8CE84_9HELO|nr:hypothetical protein BJ878DRAFT_577723 [Calycina marina]